MILILIIIIIIIITTVRLDEGFFTKKAIFFVFTATVHVVDQQKQSGQISKLICKNPVKM